MPVKNKLKNDICTKGELTFSNRRDTTADVKWRKIRVYRKLIRMHITMEKARVCGDFTMHKDRRCGGKDLQIQAITFLLWLRSGHCRRLIKVVLIVERLFFQGFKSRVFNLHNFCLLSVVLQPKITQQMMVSRVIISKHVGCPVNCLFLLCVINLKRIGMMSDHAEPKFNCASAGQV